MKFINLALVVLCAVAYTAAQAEFETYVEEEPYIPVRFRRAADPQGSINVEAKKPLSGPERRPSLNVDYNHRFYEKNGASATAYGGLNIQPRQPVQPHIGIKAERTYKNGFINAFGQAERGPHGRPSPSFGIGGGFRFRRDVDFELEDQEQY